MTDAAQIAAHVGAYIQPTEREIVPVGERTTPFTRYMRNRVMQAEDVDPSIEQTYLENDGWNVIFNIPKTHEWWKQFFYSAMNKANISYLGCTWYVQDILPTDDDDVYLFSCVEVLP